jgi:WD40 repeat protein
VSPEDAAHGYTRLRTLKSSQKSLNGVAFSPDGSTLAAAGYKGEVALWDAAHDYRRLKDLDSDQPYIFRLAFRPPDGGTFATDSGDDPQVVLWGAGNDYTKLTTLDAGQSDVSGVAYSPDGSKLAATAGSQVVLWDAAHDYSKLTTLNSGQGTWGSLSAQTGVRSRPQAEKARRCSGTSSGRTSPSW